MTANVQDLEAVAEEDLGLNLSEALTARIAQYQDANPEEILERLEEAAETPPGCAG